MTDEVSFRNASEEVLRCNAEGQLTYIHPKLAEELGKLLVDAQGATVWQRLDACDRAILGLGAQVTNLEVALKELREKLTLLGADNGRTG